jgi:cytochrome c553
LDELEAAEIMRPVELSWAKECQLKAHCCQNGTPGSNYTQCNEPISERVYFSGTMGCCVMCEKHWLQYHAKAGKTFEEIMAHYQKRAEQERQRIKSCAICHNRDANYNSSAGIDLCHRHWDEY